jgi:hypothetical protein
LQVKFDQQLAVLPAQSKHTVRSIIERIEKNLKRAWKATQARAHGVPVMF